MKKKLLFLPLFAAMLSTGCSSDEPVLEGPENGNGNNHYLSVSIVTTPESSRASANDHDDNDNYENGLDSENKVASVRFYFFDNNGDAANVKADKDANYYDWTPESDKNEGTNPIGPVEKQLKAVIVIRTKDGDKLPSKMVAIVNPNENFDNAAIDLATLRNKVNDYSKLANDSEKPSFVMFNSVYKNDAGEEISATDLTADKFKDNETDAINNPVYVYVERNVAKVRIKSSLTADDNGLIKVQYKDNNDNPIDLKVDNKQIYVKLGGWSVTGDLDKAYISKHIEHLLTNEGCFGAGENLPDWNFPAYFRSYWAEECNVGSPANQYVNYTIAAKIKFTDKNNYMYCNENAERAASSTKKATQVIIPATLCDEEGNLLTICEFIGKSEERFIDDENHTALKQSYLNHLKNSGKHYYKKTTITEGEVSKTVFQEIGESDITFKTATKAGAINEGEAGAYYVHVCLTEDSKKETTWHTSNVEGNNDVTTATAIDEVLIALPHAKIWNSGQTYYYFNIEHFNKKAGVVRNHLYDVTLSALYGLGTPVYNPDEKIYPEHPVDEDTYIAAQINILSWRIVPSDVTLNWK